MYGKGQDLMILTRLFRLYVLLLRPLLKKLLSKPLPAPPLVVFHLGIDIHGDLAFFNDCQILHCFGSTRQHQVGKCK